MTVARRLSGSASREFYQSFKQSFRQLAFIVGFVFVQVFDDVEKTSDAQLQLLVRKPKVSGGVSLGSPLERVLEESSQRV